MAGLVTGVKHPVGRALVELGCRALEDTDAARLAGIRDVEIVYHSALIASGTADELYRVNTEGTRRLLEACAGDISRFVLISTPAVYAAHPTEGSWPVLADEPREAHGRPSLFAHGQSMIAAEDLVMEASARYGMGYTLLRTTTAWGGNPYPQGLVRQLMNDPDQAELLNRTLGPLQWIHALDGARAALLAGAAEAAWNQVYLVAAEQAVTVFDLLAELWDITCPDEDNPFAEAADFHHVKRPKLDTRKIARALDFRPTKSLRYCLEEALELVQAGA